MKDYELIKVRRKGKAIIAKAPRTPKPKKNYYVAKPKIPFIERFNCKWEQSVNGCHIWHASKNNKGFGMIMHNHKMRLAHRVIWELTHGRELMPGEIVFHTCHNVACVNPSHLQLGTYSTKGKYYASTGITLVYAQNRLNKMRKNQ